MRVICLLVGVLILTGCGTMHGALKIGARAAPDPYRSALQEIERTIAERRYDPVQGHEHRGTWYFQGRIVPASDIEYESAFVKRVSAEQMVGMPTTANPIPAEERDAEREQLEQELLEIIRAARGAETKED